MTVSETYKLLELLNNKNKISIASSFHILFQRFVFFSRILAISWHYVVSKTEIKTWERKRSEIMRVLDVGAIAMDFSYSHKNTKCLAMQILAFHQSTIIFVLFDKMGQVEKVKCLCSLQFKFCFIVKRKICHWTNEVHSMNAKNKILFEM